MRRLLLPWVHTTPARLALTLGAVGLTLALLMAAGYHVVIGLVAAHQGRALRQQVIRVLPGASQLQKLRYSDGTWLPVVLGSDTEDYLYAGYDGTGRFVGYAIPGEGPGYQDTIRLLYGYRADQRRIVGMTVLDSGETSGWGDKIMGDINFLSNFRTLAVDPKIVAVDHGKKTRSNEVDVITGATLSSQAIVQILNATNRHWLKRLPARGDEPSLVENQ